MLPESELRRRRDVGCQWESREEERREVGCQSDSAERREAAIQVDLLTLQHSWTRCTGVCGGLLQCVSVRADEPGGGALLQHCSTHLLEGQHVHQTFPLYLLNSPLAHTQLLQQATPIPRMSLCDPTPLPLPVDVSAPPPGLIAPLSPRLAEEEDNEDDEDGAKLVETEQTGRRKRRMVGPPIRYLIESEEQSHGLSPANHTAARGEGGMRGLKREQEEEREDGFKPVSTDQLGRPRRKTVGPPIRYLIQSEEQPHGLLAANHGKARGKQVKRRLMREYQGEEETSVTTEAMEQMGRSNRNFVGPPIRYLLESDEQSHGRSGANRCRARGATVKMILRRLLKEPQENIGANGGVEGTEQTGRPRRKSVCPPIRYVIRSEGQAQALSQANHSSAEGAKKMLLKWRRYYAEEEEDEDDEDGVIPVKTDTDSEGESHGSSPANQNKTGGAKTKALRQEREDTEEEEEKGVLTGRTGQVGPRRMKTVSPSIRYLIESEEKSHDTLLTNQGRADGAKIMLLKQRTEEEECGVPPVQPAETQQTGRPRRKTVGPPIRYLLESEDQSHGLAPANHSKTREAKTNLGMVHQEEEEDGLKHVKDQRVTVKMGRRKPRECNVLIENSQLANLTNHIAESVQPNENGPDRITCLKRKMDDDEKYHPDRPQGVNQSEDRSSIQTVGGAEEEARRLMFTQNHRELHLPIHQAGSQKKISCAKSLRLHSHLTADDKQDDTKTDGENKEGAEEEKTLLAASTKAPQHSRYTKLVRWRLHRSTVSRRQDAERWRRWQERDRWRWRKNRRRGREEPDKRGEEPRKDGGEEEETQVEIMKEVAEQPRRPRRKMVGPPIRYLLESEELSHETRKPPQERRAGAGASDDTSVTDRTEETDTQARQTVTERQMGRTNWDSANRPSGRCGRPTKVEIDSEALGGASEMTGRSDTSERQTYQTVTEKQTCDIVLKRQDTIFPVSTKLPDLLRARKHVCQNSSSWLKNQTTVRSRQDVERRREWQEREREGGRIRKRCTAEKGEKQVCMVDKSGGGEELLGGQGGERISHGGHEKEKMETQTEEKKEVAETIQRPRRKMVGPPIRYLLESEVLSHGLVIASQDKKPQKTNKAGGDASDGASVIDCPEETAQTDRQAGPTNPDRVDKPIRRVQRPNKVIVIHSEARGETSGVSDGFDASARQTGETDPKRQTGDRIEGRQTDLTVSVRHTRLHGVEYLISPCCVRLQRLPQERQET